jgi:hypothetical protein
MLDILMKLSILEQYEIPVNELDLLTCCFKNFIGRKRNQFRKLDAIITKEKQNGKKKNKIK